MLVTIVELQGKFGPFLSYGLRTDDGGVYFLTASALTLLLSASGATVGDRVEVTYFGEKNYEVNT